jgi:hypothetical protein
MPGLLDSKGREARGSVDYKTQTSEKKKKDE